MVCCRDQVLQEDQGTGSLLTGQGDVASSQEEEEGEDEACPPLLSVPPVFLQSTLHLINLKVQQVSP